MSEYWIYVFFSYFITFFLLFCYLLFILYRRRSINIFLFKKSYSKGRDDYKKLEK